MKPHGSFEHLSKRLSAYEKKNFLNQVESHLDRVPKQKKVPAHPASEQEEESSAAIDAQITRDLQKLRGLKRLSLRMLSYWHNKPLEETFREIQLSELRKRLQSGRHAILCGKDSNISASLAELLHPVYLKVKLLRGMIHFFWSNSMVLTSYYRWCFQDKYAKMVNSDIMFFTNEEEIKAGILFPEKADELKRQIRQKITRYTDSIDRRFFEQIQQDLLPLFYLRGLLQFPFRDFFQMFGCSNPDVTQPKFTSCPSELCRRELLQLYKISLLLNGQILDRSCVVQLAQITLTSPSAGNEKSEAQLKQESQKIFEKFSDFLLFWHKFTEKIPLWNLVLYAHRNPYFVHTAKAPPLQVRGAVVRELHTDLQQQFDQLWQKVAREVLSSTEKKFIRDLEDSRLTFYSEGSAVDPGRFGQTTTFQHFHSTALIHNFLLRFYPKQLRPLMLSLIKVIPKRLPLQQKLLAVINGYENILRQLKAFDGSLAPETDRGKRLSNIIYRLEKGDINARVPLAELIQPTDEEARYLIDKFLANLQAGSKVLQDVLRNETEKLQQYLATVVPHQGQNGKSIARLVGEASNNQQEFLNLLSYGYQASPKKTN